MRIHPDKEPYWVHIKFPPVFGPDHENWGIQFVQLDPGLNEMAKLARLLKKAEREGKVLKWTFQLISKFHSFSSFEKSLGKIRTRKKRRKGIRSFGIGKSSSRRV
jgi:hypothetical protein